MIDQDEDRVRIVRANRGELEVVKALVLALVLELESLNRMEPLTKNHARIGEEFVRRVIDDERHIFLLAQSEGRAVGLAEFRVRQTLEPAAPLMYGYITWFYVQPEFRRRGVGRRLLEATRRELRQLGVEQMRLGALADNERALAFWRSMGFSPGVITMFRPIR